MFKFISLFLFLFNFNLLAQTTEIVYYPNMNDYVSKINNITNSGDWIFICTNNSGVVFENTLTGEKLFYNSLNSGLPSDNINVVESDKNGSKWIGTSDGGVVCYSGSSWIVFNKTNSGIASDCINSIAFDKEGNKWFGTSEGLSFYDGKNWTTYNMSNSKIPSNSIETISFDSQGNLWIGTIRGLVQLNNNVWNIYFQNYSIFDILIDNSGKIWIGSSYGLLEFDGSKWYSWKSRSIVNSIAIDSLGVKWLATDLGLAFYDGKTLTDCNWGSSKFRNINVQGLTSIRIGSDGIKWIGYNSGIACLNNESWSKYLIGNSGITNTLVTSMDIDSVGNKWIGTENKGLIRLKNESWLTFNKSNSPLPSDNINCIRIDKFDNKWIGTDNGLVKYDGFNWVVFKKDPVGLPDNFVQSIEFDQDENPWVCTKNGLAFYNGLNWEIFNKENSAMNGNDVKLIVIDKKNNKWVTTDAGGVFRYDNKTWDAYKPDNSGLPAGYIKDIEIDSSGTMWFSMSSGIAKFNGSKWTFFSSNKLPINTPYSCTFFDCKIDKFGNKWFGTDNGLLKYNDNSWYLYNTKNSLLPFDYIKTLTIDKNGYKWLGVNSNKYGEIERGGLVVFNEGSLSVTTQKVTNIKDTSATFSGKVLIYGNANVKKSGFCWGKNQNPSVYNSYVTFSEDNNNLLFTALNLMPNENYFVRAFSSNNFGITYGEQIKITTIGSGVISNQLDYNGESYRTIIIGNQEWLMEDLRTTKYNDGKNIPNITEPSSWAQAKKGGYCISKSENKDFPDSSYLYNWHTIATGKLAPLKGGWRVPSDSDWTTLENYIGGKSIAGQKLKAKNGWKENGTGTNDFSFTALPSLQRDPISGFFFISGQKGYWWSSNAESNSDAWFFQLSHDAKYSSRYFASKNSGYSVRLVRDK
ncbi:MAG: hypothetical protein LCH54_13850 [Bacteroidetes bacterium]|nr:hypothetical protein [Bacteroidota bacterium]